MSKLARLAVFALLAACFAFVSASPAHASAASDGYKAAKALKKKVDAASSDSEREAAQKELSAFVLSKSEWLGKQELSKMDTMYLGQLQGVGGFTKDAVKTLRKAMDHPGKTKYASTIHLYYVRALLAADDFDTAFAAFEDMTKRYEGEKNVKITAMSVGIGMRRGRSFKKSAAAFEYAVKKKNMLALKPCVHSHLMAGQRDQAVAIIETAMKLAAEKDQPDENHPVLLDITKRFNEQLTLEFDAFSPKADLDLNEKVVVMAFWHGSAGSLRYTFAMLNAIYDEFPPTSGVETLGVTTYYKKNLDTGMFEDDMTKEAEQAVGLQFRETHKFEGQLAYVADRDALKALGCTAFPYVVIRSRDGRLIYAHTINRKDPAEIDIIREVIKKALK